MAVRRIAVALVVAFVVGCAGQGGEKPLSQKDKAKQNWNSARAGVQLRLARQQYENGNLDDCRKSLDQAVALDPENPQIRIQMAKLHIEQGRLDQAEKQLQEAAARDAQNGEVDYLYGVIYQRWQRAPAALEAYERAGQKRPDELAYLLARAEMMVAMDKMPEALALLRERMIYFENSAAIRDAVGQLLVQQGQYSQAVTVLRQANILAPEELAIREHLALAHYYGGNYREAGQLLDRLLKEEKYGTRADLLTALGECHMQLGRTREARECYESAAQHDPGNARVWLGLAKSAHALNDLPRVELSVRKAMSLDASSSEVHLMLGYLRLGQGRLDDAIKAFRKASSLDPKDSVSLCMIGFVLEKQGRPAEAIQYYAKALKVKPDDELAATLMAQVKD